VTSGGVRGSIITGLNAHPNALVEGVTYTSALPALTGQAGFSVLAGQGWSTWVTFALSPKAPAATTPTYHK
jgi:hypothetical protein